MTDRLKPLGIQLPSKGRRFEAEFPTGTLEDISARINLAISGDIEPEPKLLALCARTYFLNPKLIKDLFVVRDASINKHLIDTSDVQTWLDRQGLLPVQVLGLFLHEENISRHYYIAWAPLLAAMPMPGWILTRLDPYYFVKTDWQSYARLRLVCTRESATQSATRLEKLRDVFIKETLGEENSVGKISQYRTELSKEFSDVVTHWPYRSPPYPNIEKSAPFVPKSERFTKHIEDLYREYTVEKNKTKDIPPIPAQKNGLVTNGRIQNKSFDESEYRREVHAQWPGELFAEDESKSYRGMKKRKLVMPKNAGLPPSVQRETRVPVPVRTPEVEPPIKMPPLTLPEPEPYVWVHYAPTPCPTCGSLTGCMHARRERK